MESKKKEEKQGADEAEKSVETPEGAEQSASESAPAAEKPTDEKPADEQSEPAKDSEAKSTAIDWKDQYARLLADFDNYKKRAIRDREDTYRYAESDILGDILPTCDNLALALANAKNKDDDFVKGVQLVYEALVKSLKSHGAEPFDSVGEALDTERMEAIATLPSDKVEEGRVSNEVKRGWMLKGKVLRAAQVVVSSGVPSETK